MVVEAIHNHDYFVVQTTIMIFALIFLVVNLHRGHRLRLHQPADPVLLMASITRRPRPARHQAEAGPAAACGATRSAPAAQRAGDAGARADHRVFVFAALFAPVIAPVRAARRATLADRLQPPSPQHIMGTDLQGRDEYQPHPLRRAGQPRRGRSRR